MKNFDETRWEPVRKLLRENLDALALGHPDFVNSRVLEAIEREGREPRRVPFFPLVRLVWAGVGLLVAAALLSAVLLPREAGFRSEEEFISQVVDARSEMPRMSLTSFRAPDDRGVVLWIEGAEYIPADQPVR